MSVVYGGRTSGIYEVLPITNKGWLRDF